MPPSKTTRYRYVGETATNVRIGDNVVPIGMGDFIEVSDDDLKHDDNAGLFGKDSEAMIKVEGVSGNA